MLILLTLKYIIVIIFMIVPQGLPLAAHSAGFYFMKNYNKPALSINEQISLLQSRGLMIKIMLNLFWKN